MGFKNFMFEGSYLNISRLIYSKSMKHVSCTLEICGNNQSSIKEVYASGSQKVLGVRIANTPPKNPKNGDTFLLKGDLQGVWEKYPKHIASWDSVRNDWNYWLAVNWGCLYLEDTQKYIRIVNEELVPCTCYDDERIWDKFFHPQKINGSDHIKQFYLYLKSLDEFKDCVDA